MKLSDLDWGEPETGGLPKATYSVVEARFRHRDRAFLAVEWFRRTGHPFHPYASVVLIAEECDRTGDGALLRAIAFSAAGESGSRAPRLVRSETLGRRVILIQDPRKREIDLRGALEEILRPA
jgi:hypothetical protein